MTEWHIEINCSDSREAATVDFRVFSLSLLVKDFFEIVMLPVILIGNCLSISEAQVL